MEDYALFMAISEEKGIEWQTWGEDLKYRKASKIKEEKKRLQEKIGYYYFEQYLFYKQ
jgi:4-alpha-glucanotransferase